MLYTNGATVNDVYPKAVRNIIEQGVSLPSRNGGMLEIHPVTLGIQYPMNRLVTSFGRPVNPAFALAEVVWILTGQNTVEMLKYYNGKIDQYSDDGVTFNAAYGYRLREEFGFNQLADVIQLLKEDPNTRQAVLNIWSPRRDCAYIGHDEGIRRDPDTDELVNGRWPHKNNTADRACNIASHMMIRDGRLDWMQVMRSNDIIWGTPNNFMQWMHVMEYIARSVGVDLGTYHHIVDSFHLYNYHKPEAVRIDRFDLYEELGQGGHAEMAVTDEVLFRVLALEESIRRGIRTDSLPGHDTSIGPYWRQVMQLFKAWHLYKEGRDEQAMTALASMSDDVLAAAQMRYFYYWRWHKLEHATVLERYLKQENLYPESVRQWITDTNVQLRPTA